ncbi:MAG TPA: NAD(P)-dependent oxidoreductase [Streptosporangiaceae bacterium]
MILITGGLGFIGAHVARAVLDLGESCVLAQRRTGSVPAFLAGEPAGRVVVEQADVTDQRSIRELGERHRITGIVHLATGLGYGAASIADARACADGLLNVLEAAGDWRVPRVGVASTIGVYAEVAGPGANPLREDMPLALTAGHPIPLGKKVTELLSGYIAGGTGMEIYNIRIGAAWGPLGRTPSPFMAAPQLVHAAARGETAPPAYADDAIDLIYVKDCGRAIALLQLAERLRYGTYNVSSGRATTNKELAAAVAKVVPDAPVDLRDGADPNGTGHEIYLDITRLRQDTGFAPGYDTERAVADYVDWLRAGHER